MPCYRCGARQTDPDRGQSPWRRGVRGDCQVLVCPDCQVARDWAGDLNRCPQCRGVHLVRRLGEVECRDCGAVVPPSGAPDDSAGLSVPAGPGGLSVPGDALPGAAAGAAAGRVTGEVTGELSRSGEAPGLSEEVARALERVLGHSAVRR
jgi:hypothetical protein